MVTRSPLHLFTPSAFLRVLCALALLLTLSCRKAPLPGSADLPPGVVKVPGVFKDIAPRWSPDGKRIAFLRQTTDRRLQLCVTDRNLSHVVSLLEPEIVSPDRPCRPGRSEFRAPEGPAWSPDGRHLAFSRVEWFTFEDGQRLPGTSLWSYDFRTGRAQRLAVHPKEYEGDFFYFRSPQWSPDGKRIAFIGEGVKGETALYVRTLAGTGPEMDRPRFDDYDDVDWPAWSPDGKRLVFRQGILRAMTADPVETLRVIEPGGTKAMSFRLWPGFRVVGHAWSPDGFYLACALTSDLQRPETGQVWTLNMQRILNRVKERLVAERSSPEDGRGYVAPVWIEGKHHGEIGALRPAEGGWEAVAFPVSGGPARALCRLPSDDCDWSPDRRRIVCSVPTEGKPAGLTTLRIMSTGVSRGRARSR